VFAELETPAVLVDVDVLDRNLTGMAERARAAGVRLRPHAKTHKTAQVAGRQRAAGATGLSVAKTGEAEAFADAGFDDLFVAYPVVGADKGRRLLALHDRIRLAVGADSVEGAETLARVFAGAGRTLDVVLKIDVGLHRVGVLPEHAAAVARQIADQPGLRLTGIFTHAGHAYGGQTPDAVAAVARDEGRTMATVAEALRAAGLPIATVSVGSTPTARDSMVVPGVTECRPGNYVFHDRTQVALGTCRLEDCALTVLATVVSVPADSRAVVDAGSKVLSSDPLRPRPDGHGLVLGTRTTVARLSEEHGVLEVAPGDRFRVGERVLILPNHACVVTNLQDRIWTVSGGQVLEPWSLIARGRVQ
jgi:D-serine deaminase-like pyridoxal phosphate-dependent protein